MKKIFRTFICIMICIVLVGCSSQSEPQENKIENFVDQYKESVETFSNSIIDATLLARGKSIVYSYTYKTTYSKEETDAMIPALEKGIESNKEVFTELLKTLRDVDSTAESVIIEYYNGDNTLITSIEYK